MRTADAAWAPGTTLCLWHTLAKHVLPFRCSHEQRPGRSTCAQHSAELDLRLFEFAYPAHYAWVIYWASGSRLMRRCGASELAQQLLEREPDGLLEHSQGDRAAMELRVHGRLVALIRRLEWFK